MIRIYYFTGTGNSLKFARDLQMELGAELLPLAGAVEKETDLSEVSAVGIVFPVYYYEVPTIVRDFINKLKPGKDTYIFGIVTCGGNEGNVLAQLDRLLGEKGSRLSYGAAVYMPDNSLVATPGEEVQARMFNEEEKRAGEIAGEIKARKETTIRVRKRVKTSIKKVLMKLAMKTLYRYENKRIESHCTHCGICEKICPVGNIRVENGSVVWGNKCVQCFACINWCPSKAVRFGNLRVNKRRQYHHPEAALKDILIK